MASLEHPFKIIVQAYLRATSAIRALAQHPNFREIVMVALASSFNFNSSRHKCRTHATIFHFTLDLSADPSTSFLP